MNVGFEINTKVLASGTILSEVLDAGRHRLFASVVHTQEQGIRDALVLLGWIPPSLPTTALIDNETPSQHGDLRDVRIEHARRELAKAQTAGETHPAWILVAQLLSMHDKRHAVRSRGDAVG